jgi:hypothetical protein
VPFYDRGGDTLALPLRGRRRAAGAAGAGPERFARRLRRFATVAELWAAIMERTSGHPPSELVASLEDARDKVLERVANITETRDSASTLPAVSHAARMLQDTGSPFSAIVILTGRAIDARVPVEGDLLPSITESGAAVHVVESQASQLDATDALGGDAVPDLLRVLADQTHGQYTTIFSSASYGTALDRLADKLSAELMIQYLVPAGEPAGDVQVGVRRPGSRVVGLGVK